MSANSRAADCEGRRDSTVNVCAPVLAAHFAVDAAHTRLLVHAHGHRLLMIAEEALEDGRKRLFLHRATG